MYHWALILLSITGQSPVWKWIHRLGGFGLIFLGLADNSAVPLPGSMDVFTILLSAHNRAWWPYYGAMATTGAVLGGYATYRLAEKGEKAFVEKKIGKKRAEGVYKRFEKHGFLWVFFGAILPPPFPIVPVLTAAGALHYPRGKFLAALGVGRGARYFLLAYIARMYGRAIIHFLAQYHAAMLYGMIGTGVAAGSGVFVYLKWYRPKQKQPEPAIAHEDAQRKVA